MIRASKRLGFVLGLSTLLWAGQAQARTEVLRFTHPDPGTVASYRVYVGSAAGQSDLLSQTVTASGPDASGVYTAVIEVASETTLYIRMTALGSVESSPSNEIERSVQLGLPGTPTVILP